MRFVFLTHPVKGQTSTSKYPNDYAPITAQTFDTEEVHLQSTYQ